MPVTSLDVWHNLCHLRNGVKCTEAQSSISFWFASIPWQRWPRAPAGCCGPRAGRADADSASKIATPAHSQSELTPAQSAQSRASTLSPSDSGASKNSASFPPLSEAPTAVRRSPSPCPRPAEPPGESANSFSPAAGNFWAPSQFFAQSSATADPAIPLYCKGVEKSKNFRFFDFFRHLHGSLCVFHFGRPD